MALPISLDYYVNLGTDSPVNFRLSRLEGSTYRQFFEGMAYPMPGFNRISVNIAAICAERLRFAFPPRTSLFFSADYDLGEVIKVEKFVASGWSYVTEVIFCGGYVQKYGILSDPVRREYPVGLPVYIGHQGSSGTVTLYSGSQPISTISIPASNGGVFIVSDSDTRGARMSIVISGYRLDLEPASVCSNYVFYYRNAYGGYDTLIPKGNIIQRDELVRHNVEAYRRPDYNSAQWAVGSRTYATDMAKVFTINTGPLTTDEASRMYHILNSPEVYLCDYRDGTYFPVLLRNSVTEYKTVDTEGGLVNYQLECEAPNTLTIR